MSYHFRPLEELNVIDDFLMNAIANDPDVGVPFLPNAAFRFAATSYWKAEGPCSACNSGVDTGPQGHTHGCGD